MIIDLQRFLREERPYWTELEQRLDRIESEAQATLGLEQARRLHYLYERAAADLSKVSSAAADIDLRRYLEVLVSRAYGQIHEVRGRPNRFAPIRWIAVDFPRTFRKHIWAFWLSTGITIVGCMFGGGAITFDPGAKSVLMPFPHLIIDPKERVALEEQAKEKDERADFKAIGTSFYIRNNVGVSITTLALGITWGVGTVIILFINGVMLGAVVLDYVLAGEGVFVTAWLLPHGAVEIPAILLAGQAGLMLGRGLIGWGSRVSVRGRMRELAPDLVTIIAGVALMLVWAAIVEAYLSQYHEPTIPYAVKIVFGVTELIALALYLSFSGRWKTREEQYRLAENGV